MRVLYGDRGRGPFRDYEALELASPTHGADNAVLVDIEGDGLPEIVAAAAGGLAVLPNLGDGRSVPGPWPRPSTNDIPCEAFLSCE